MATLERGRPEILDAKETSFSRWLKEARQKKGWSGEQLAAEVGTSQSMISAYERGFRSPRRKRAAEIAEALGADPREALEALMKDTPGLNTAQPPLDYATTEDEAEVLSIYRSAGQKGAAQSRRILAIMREMVKEHEPA